ncbi:MAG: glycosyltransferase [Acidobacteriia bacterium]|nr:glycosyltransferase [Terriglobia bacterium]
MPEAKQEPLVSIVTPSLNMGRFLEETLRSVLDQDYPHVEYLVMDGGSTDGTLELLQQYEGRLRYISQPDRGQADAVNRGFSVTSGAIFAFLNADDTYLPGAISAAVQAFAEHPEAGVVYGDAWYVAENGSRMAPYPVEAFEAANLARRCFICQPAAFFRRQAFAAVGSLDANLRFALDYDLWIRMARRYPMVKIDRDLATSRIHGSTKTMGETGPAMRETLSVLERHFGYVPYNWVYGYGHHCLTGQPLAIETPRATLSSACYSVALGARYNWRHPLRYCRDILATAKKGLA